MSRPDPTPVAIPGGFWVNGERHRESLLRPLTGHEEGFLAEVGPATTAAARTTYLLTHCLSSLGPLDPVSPDAVRRLSVGDREALLLHLRRLTLGDQIDCVLRCPSPACGEMMDLQIRVGDLLVPAYPDAMEWHERVIDGGSSAYRVRFRLPSGKDQEKAAASGLERSLAARDILRACISEIGPADSPERRLEAVPASVERILPAVMSELDRQAELMLNLTCPACGRPFHSILDMGSFLFEELQKRFDDVHGAVHLLAYYYHWSEGEILDLPSTRRQRYVASLMDEIRGYRHGRGLS